jgi:Metalloenzyme superfamily
MRWLICLIMFGVGFAEEAGSAAPLPAPAAWAWGGVARHVVIAVIDGPRWSETWGKPGQPDIPRQATELAPLGTRYTNFRNTGWTYTNCGHTALTTGFYEHIENSDRELPGHASLFQYFRLASGMPAEATWLVTSKDKLYVLANTSDAAWRGRLQPRTDCGVPAAVPLGGYRDDRATLVAAKKVLQTFRPAFMLINFKEPDASGHAKNWQGYMQGIRDTDSHVFELWQTIQGDPELRDRTDLFITNDHGRHLDGHGDGYVSHGDDCEGCRHISLLAVGPDIAVGKVIEQQRNQVDLSVTVGFLVGVSLPGSSGQVMRELLRN